jgi:hypothetical protein
VGTLPAELHCIPKRVKILGGKRVEKGEIFAWDRREKFNLQSRSFGCAGPHNGVTRDIAALLSGADFRREMRVLCAANESEFAAAFHGFHHGYFVGVFEVGANGNADTDARDAHAERLQQFREVDSGSFAFGGGVRRHDDFFDGAFFQALDERFDTELLGATSLQRRKRAAENVIHTAVGPGFFDRENVVGFFDDTDRSVIAGWADAVEARICVGEVAAGGALADFFFGVADGVGQRHGFFRRGAQEVKGQALRGLLSNAGKMFESVDQSFNRGGEIRHE